MVLEKKFRNIAKENSVEREIHVLLSLLVY